MVKDDNQKNPIRKIDEAGNWQSVLKVAMNMENRISLSAGI